ncbi:MAG: hypothetical protein JWR10_4826 [Rubritepida sp.]|nr:hypothetical protein [Rubritepida sp.]
MGINQLIAASGARTGSAFTKSSGLRWKVVRMISTNSLAAFTQEVTRTRPGTDAGSVQRSGRAGRPEFEEVAQRKLDAVPPAPSKPLPRGSLLDLRV